MHQREPRYASQPHSAGFAALMGLFLGRGSHLRGICVVRNSATLQCHFRLSEHALVAPAMFQFQTDLLTERSSAASRPRSSLEPM